MSSNNFVAQKREQFQTQIRRSQREKIFNQKRIFNPDNQQMIKSQEAIQLIIQKAHEVGILNKNNEQCTLQQVYHNLALLDLQQLKRTPKFISFLIVLFKESQEINHVNSHLITMASLCLGIYLDQINESLLLSDDEQIKNGQKLVRFCLSTLCFISFHNANLAQYILDQYFINQIVLVMISCHDRQILLLCSKFLYNLLIDESEYVHITLIDNDLFEKIINEIIDQSLLQDLNNDLQYLLDLLDQLTTKYKEFGTKHLSLLMPIIIRIQNENESQSMSESYQGCVIAILKILQHITIDIELNQPRVYQLFNELIKQQVVKWIAKLIIDTNNHQIMNTAWEILLNLSQIDGEFSVQMMINQDALLAIQLQINTETCQCQSRVYLFLANIISSLKNRKQIFDTGIMARVYGGFNEAIKDRNPDLNEITQCILSAYQSSDEDCIRYLNELGLLDCLIQYITHLDIPEQNVNVIEEIVIVCVTVLQMRNKIRLTNQISQNHGFIMKLEQYQTYELDDRIHNAIEDLITLLK